MLSLKHEKKGGSISILPHKWATTKAARYVFRWISTRLSLFHSFDSLNQSATCRIRNTFGGAETFEANLAFATKTRVSFNASLGAPLTRTLGTRGEISLFGLERDNSSYASHTEGVRGVKALVRVSLG